MPPQVAATADIPPPPVLSQDQLRLMPGGMKLNPISPDLTGIARTEKFTAPNTVPLTPAVGTIPSGGVPSNVRANVGMTNATPDSPIRAQTVQYWIGQGVNPQAAEGIADALQPESGFNPGAYKGNDNGAPSGGIYQHHGERLERLQEYAASQGKSWTDPTIQHQFANLERQSGNPYTDQTVAQHWQEIANAPDRATAKALWQRYFERGTLQGGAEGAGIPYANEQQAAAQAIQADLYGASDRARKQADGFMSEVKDFKKDLAGSLQRIHEARGHSDEAIAKATEAANYQPKPPLIDGFANLGSLGAIIGMMGGLLTKSPMIASLNAGAAAIEAANRGDMAQYERAYDSWKTSSDMLFKIVDLQQKRAQEIMGDEQFMTEEKRVGLDLYLRAIHQEELANDIRIKGDQFGYEHFRNMGAAAEQYRKDQLQLEEFHARLGNQKTYDTPKNVEVLDAKGNSLWQGAAERDHQGNWTKSGSHDALPQGEIKLMPGNAMVIGSRENVLIQRSLVAGKEITSELSNLAQMNVSVSSGMFGGRQQGPSLFDASKEVLANTVTGQEVQLYNDSVAGLQRELAGLITGGVYINQETVNSFNQLTLKEGDTQLTKLHKMATIRQNTENALDALLVNPRVDKTQKEYARQQIKTLRHAIPWTPSDVIKLHNSQNPGISLKDLGIQMGLGGDAELPPEIPSGSKKTDKTIGGKAVYEATDGSFWTEN